MTDHQQQPAADTAADTPTSTPVHTPADRPDNTASTPAPTAPTAPTVLPQAGDPGTFERNGRWYRLEPPSTPGTLKQYAEPAANDGTQATQQPEPGSLARTTGGEPARSATGSLARPIDPPYATDQKRRWLETYRSCGNLRETCRQVGIDRGVPYRWAQADPEFSRAWSEALEVLDGDLQDGLYRRAQGEGMPANVAAVMLGKRWHPERWSEKHIIVNAGDTAAVQVLREIAARLGGRGGRGQVVDGEGRELPALGGPGVLACEGEPPESGHGESSRPSA